MKFVYLLFIIFTPILLFWGCGDVSVNVDDNTYEPKIVVDGYLFPDEVPQNIKLARNYPLNSKIDLTQFYITDAEVSITDISKNNSCDLVFDPPTFSYKYPGKDFMVSYGNSYRLTVSAIIDGKKLTTSSITTVPEHGFRISEENSFLGPIHFNEAVKNNQKINIEFYRSPTTDSYAGSIVALDASLDNFIEGNVFGIEKDVIDDMSNIDEMTLFNNLKNQAYWSQTKLGEGDDLAQVNIEWFSTWFYGRYRVILYAADRNFTDYFLTHNQIQEIDGNLLEPRFHFEGNGIGVFGSAVRDTVYFEIFR